MPLPDGTLTDMEFEHVQNRLLELWGAHEGKPPCRSCGHQSYYIHPSLIGNRSDTLGVQEPHTRLPTIGVYCGQCGLLDQYSARMLGIQVLLPPITPPTHSIDVF